MYDFFDWIIYFLASSLPTMLMDFFLWILGFIGYVVIKIINVLLDNVVPLIDSEDFGKSTMWDGLESAWNSLPSEILQIATYIQIPEAVSIITSALLISFARKKIPFIGR